MSWIQTYTGRKVNPLSMSASDVRIEDIAHALAMTCRFTGHCPHFYSVAQHSVLVSQNCQVHKLWGLLHDAAEAYCADLARPVKLGLREKGVGTFDEIERSIMGAVCANFGLHGDEPSEVKRADSMLLVTEAKVFFGDTELYLEWHHRPENGFDMIEPPIIVPWDWVTAEGAFLDAFKFLS